MAVVDSAGRWDAAAIGMTTAMVVILVLALPLFPFAVVLVGVVRVKEWAPPLARRLFRRPVNETGEV
jgi:hypothetical protein